MTELDSFYLEITLKLAKSYRGKCFPNPCVGAVIVDTNNQVLASAAHTGSGKPHAELAALQQIDMRAPNASLYVSLEPCCHWGKTPPCTTAIIESGIKRVVYAYPDPNPIVCGKGAVLLKQAGIQCEHIPHSSISEFYASYEHWQQHQTPFLTAKIALTLNGNTAAASGQPIAITGSALNELTHLKRLESDALLTTAKTILHDDPSLNARYQNQTTPKPLYILDRQLQLPKTAKVLHTAKSITLFHEKQVNPSSQIFFENQGIRCIEVESDHNALNLQQIVKIIGQDGVHDVWIEAGGECFNAFVTAELLQKAYIYVSLKWEKDGLNAFRNHFNLNAKQYRWQQYGNDVLCEVHW